MGIFNNIKSLFGKGVNYQEMIEKGAVIIDVRSPSEFNSGHAKGSKNIPMEVLNRKAKTLQDKDVILVCRSGARAERAKSILRGFGIDAHNAGAWQNLS